MAQCLSSTISFRAKSPLSRRLENREAGDTILDFVVLLILCFSAENKPKHCNTKDLFASTLSPSTFIFRASERLREITDRRARRKREAANTARAAAAMMTMITAWEEEQEEREGRGDFYHQEIRWSVEGRRPNAQIILSTLD